MLDAREIALALWLAAFAAYAAGRRNVGVSIGGWLARIWGPGPLRVLIFSTTGYVVAIVFGLWRIGYWESSLTKVTVLWFLGSTIGSVVYTGNADIVYFRRLVAANIVATAFIEFISNLHPFSLPVELILVPVTALLVGSQAVARNRPQSAVAYRLATWGLILLGLTALFHALSYLVPHWREAATLRNLKDFFLPVILTACFIPFLYAVRMIGTWRQILVHTRLGMLDDSLYRFTRLAITSACGFSLVRAEQFETRFRYRLWAATDVREVWRVMQRFRRFVRRARI